MTRSRLRKTIGPFCFLALLSTSALDACVGTTGGEHISFRAAWSGPRDIQPGQPVVFTNAFGYRISLSRARLRIGAVYLNRAVPLSAPPSRSCFLPGVYIAQMEGPFEVDALSPALQYMPNVGEAIVDSARSAEVWLNNGAIDSIQDSATIVDIAGIAEREGQTFPFDGKISIGSNRIEPTSSITPGENPICRKRIASPIAVEFVTSKGGELHIQVDPRAWFTTIDFSTLPQVSTSPSLFRFTDTNDTAADVNLYNAIRATSGTYTLEWRTQDSSLKR